MIKNYFTTAWRNIIRNKTNSFINITGLALGIACCLFIFLWVQDEEGIDNFHSKGNHLYSVYERIDGTGVTNGDYNTPVEYGNTSRKFLLENIKYAVPEIKSIAFYATGYDLPWGHPETIQVGEKIIKFDGARASSSFFDMFSYKIIAGDGKNPLKDIGVISISRRMAETFFGNAENAIGKSIRYENKYSFIVSSVFENLTAKSSLKFDFLLNWDLQKGKLQWSSNDFKTFIQLADNANAAQAETKINSYLKPLMKLPPGFKVNIGLQKFGDGYLHNIFVNGKPTTGRIDYVKIFSEVAIFILVIACINFMNMATARSIKRAKEVGVRKVIGSSRGNLIVQFYGESLAFAFLAMILALALVIIFLPVFNKFTDKQFGLPFNDTPFLLVLIALTLITGIVAGSYPAIYLSALKPVKVLKGVLKFTQGSVWFRKGLTIFQFTLTIVLLIATIVITRQINYVQNTHLGYDRENLVYMRIEGTLSKKENYLLFKQKALQMPGISMVDRTTEVPQIMSFVVNDDQITWQGKEKNSAVGIKPASVGFDFVKLMRLKIVKGRDFSVQNPTDSVSAFLINEEAVKAMGMKNPIGQSVAAWKKKGYIIGVLKDYHTQSLHEPMKPVLLDVKEGEYFGVIVARTQPGQTAVALKSLETVYKQINPAYPFTYQFVDQEYKKLYANERIISQLSIVFAIIAILISCLGLLGLVMFSAQQRTKEFGVRKVLGASLLQIIGLFAIDFVILIFIAFIIAAPVGWYFMRSWLASFAYRIDISFGVILIAGACSLIFSLSVLSYEAFKTALTNPVKSLRSE